MEGKEPYIVTIAPSSPNKSHFKTIWYNLAVGNGGRGFNLQLDLERFNEKHLEYSNRLIFKSAKIWMNFDLRTVGSEKFIYKMQ